ncbi:MAG: GntR family transcriptional regulator [Lachnospiraceae bacterium]|nr:GntR family transcriptional regulator [Lachnospiraceae bacterium]
MIQINYQDKRPIYEQVVERFRQLIVKGVLSEDDKIPSVRNLAIDLSINPNTIQKAYQELERLGFIYTVKGRGNFVCGRDRWMEDETTEVLQQLKTCVHELISLGMQGDGIVDTVRTEVKKCANGKDDAAAAGDYNRKGSDAT